MDKEGCPICGAMVPRSEIEQHVNRCLDNPTPPSTTTTTHTTTTTDGYNPFVGSDVGVGVVGTGVGIGVGVGGGGGSGGSGLSTSPPMPTFIGTQTSTMLSPSNVALLAEVEELRRVLNQVNLENQKLREEVKELQLTAFKSEEMCKLLQQELRGSSPSLRSSDGEVDVVTQAYRIHAQRLQQQREAKQLAMVIDVVEKWRAFARARVEIEESERLIQEMLMDDKRQREEELANKTYECSICFCDYKLDDIYVLDGCTHRFCRDCLTGYLKVKIGEGTAAVKKISCPSAGCKFELTFEEVKQLLDKETFAKYERFNLEAALESMPDLRWCPKANCQNAMIGDPKRPMMVCTSDKCRYTFCFNCKEEWHADATCEQYQRWKVENSEAEARYQDWVKQNARPCPRCKSPIEKNGGCNHMTCQKCSHQFCWLCNIDYKAGHYNDEGPCKGKQFT